MFNSIEGATRALLTAKSIDERNCILKAFYTLNLGDKKGADAFRYHLVQMEIVASHLFTITYAVGSVEGVKRSQFSFLATISVESIDTMLSAKVVILDPDVAKVWRSLKRLYLAIADFDGDPETLFQIVRLGHLSVRAFLETWSSRNPPVSSFYYCETQVEFAKQLPFPILVGIPSIDNLAALEKNTNLIVPHAKGWLAVLRKLLREN